MSKAAKAVEAIKNSHSSFWLDEDLWEVDEGELQAGVDINKVIRLATVRRAIANFVSILSGKNVPVYFQGADSYTDGKHVVIAADDNPANFDVAVGLALHEASHIMLSDLEWLESLMHIGARYRGASSLQASMALVRGDKVITVHAADSREIIEVVLRPEILADANRIVNTLASDPNAMPLSSIKATVYTEYLKHIKTIMNILEDRRIDQFVYSTAGGYRPYYIALYEKYFFNKEASKFIRLDAEARVPTMDNYINHMLFHIHPDSDPDALPGLREIFETMDLKNVHLLGPEYDAELDPNNLTYEMTPKLWQKANDIMVEIIKNVQLNVDENSEDEGEGESVGGGGEGDGEGEAPMSEGPDGQSVANGRGAGGFSRKGKRPPQEPRKGDGKYDPKKSKKAIDNAKSMLDGEVKKKKITKNVADSITALEEAKGEMVDVKFGSTNAPCMVTRDITERLLTEEWFPFSYGAKYPTGGMADAIAAGRRMGQILHQRLQIRNDPTVTRQTRLPSGKIERRLLANLGMDNTDVFFRSRTDKHRPVMLHLTIDASGSMYGRKFNKSMTVATAIAYLSSKMDNVESVISIRGGDNVPIVSVLFDSRRDDFRKWMKFAPYIYARGGTPEGLCFQATMDLVLESKHTHDVYFINFSDGAPGFSVNSNATISGGGRGRWTDYSGDTAYDHTRKMVNLMRENDIKVLSYFINEGSIWPGIRNAFKRMYGDDASFVDVASVTNVLNTLNTRLKKR